MKKFEEFVFIGKGDPNINDYVICEPKFIVDSCKIFNVSQTDVENFLKNNIGRIIDITSAHYYKIQYNNIPNNIQNFFKYFEVKRNEIIKHSKNKEDLEIIIMSKKYNI
jgi:hypothetical protein